MLTSRTLALFHRAAQELPAYQDFLRASHIDAAGINTPEELSQAPLTRKKTYLTTHKTSDLLWPSDQAGSLLLCATSGSTGEPYYFPRNDALSAQYSFMLEDYLNHSSFGNGSTLVIIGFGMGVWIGGVITMRAFEIAGQRMKMPLSILPAGNNKPEIFRALRKLAPQFDQTILVGYPPLIKELIDESEGEEVDLKKLNLRFLFAAEAFTETFRDYICSRAGIADPLSDTMNVYGSADNGAMAGETPLSILIRRLATERKELYRDIFGQVEKMPTLAQYNPNFIEFESVRGEIALSADGALPLIRYAIGDHGGVMEYEQLLKVMSKHGLDLEAIIRQEGIEYSVRRDHPFVYVYERIDMSTTVYGINIFPEFIREGLLHPSMTKHFSGRFTMATKNDEQQSQHLQINLELRKGVTADNKLVGLAQEAILDSLLKRSSEFADLAKNRTTDGLLQIVLWPKGHSRYFKVGTKQKWVEKA